MAGGIEDMAHSKLMDPFIAYISRHVAGLLGNRTHDEIIREFVRSCSPCSRTRATSGMPSRPLSVAESWASGHQATNTPCHQWMCVAASWSDEFISMLHRTLAAADRTVFFCGASEFDQTKCHSKRSMDLSCA